jgi:hypothetical protein
MELFSTVEMFVNSAISKLDAEPASIQVYARSAQLETFYQEMGPIIHASLVVQFRQDVRHTR